MLEPHEGSGGIGSGSVVVVNDGDGISLDVVEEEEEEEEDEEDWIVSADAVLGVDEDVPNGDVKDNDDADWNAIGTKTWIRCMCWIHSIFFFLKKFECQLKAIAKFIKNKVSYYVPQHSFHLQCTNFSFSFFLYFFFWTSPSLFFLVIFFLVVFFVIVLG